MKLKFFLLLTLPVLMFLPFGIQAQEEATESSDAMLEKPIDYYLPHPGLLPDHPLYWLKMIRDRFGLWLAWQPEVKAEKLLNYADKRLGAGWTMIENGELNLGLSTLTKGEKYLEQAIKLKQHLNEERINKAIAKHKEVLLLLEDKTNDQHQAVMQQMLDKLNN
jgi:hypothetical protein